MINNKYTWFTCNNITDKTLPYITSLFDHYRFINYQFIINNGKDSILIPYMLNTYLVNVNEEKNRLEIWKRNKAKNPKGNEKYHEKAMFFDSDDAWLDLCNWIREQK